MSGSTQEEIRRQPYDLVDHELSPIQHQHT